MAVYDVRGNDLHGTVYSVYGARLQQAYDILGEPLILSRLVVNDDASTGQLSGYSLISKITGKSYVLRQVYDFGAEGFQSIIIDPTTFLFNLFNETAIVTQYTESMSNTSAVTLSSAAGHKNDAAYHNGFFYMVDGTQSFPKLLYIWDTSSTSVSHVTLPIPDNTNGSLRVVAGISKDTEDGKLYLISRDQYNGNDILHQNGDVMCVYSYNAVSNTAEIVASYPWDCVFVQGATFNDSILYVTCNTQTTGSASNYAGITVKCIRTDTWEMIDELTVSGVFEPEGMDTVNFTEYGNELTMGMGHYQTLAKFVRFTPPYKLVASNS